MSWIFLAITGYFLYAVVTVINKFLLRQSATTNPLVFTFWVGVLSVFVLVLAPLGLIWPGLGWFLFDFGVGAIFFLALLAYYKALDINEASRSASVIGATIPLLVLILSFSFLGERLGQWQILAFLFLVAGGALMSLQKSQGGFKGGLKGLPIVALAIILGAIYWVLAKFIFDQQGFISGFIWTRLGFAATSLIILCWPRWRRLIFSATGRATERTGILMIGAKFLAAFGSLFVHWALALGSVALVNAMQGIEYLFLLILVIVLSRFHSKVLREKITGGALWQKAGAVILIILGLGCLAL